MKGADCPVTYLLLTSFPHLQRDRKSNQRSAQAEPDRPQNPEESSTKCYNQPDSPLPLPGIRSFQRTINRSFKQFGGPEKGWRRDRLDSNQREKKLRKGKSRDKAPKGRNDEISLRVKRERDNEKSCLHKDSVHKDHSQQL